MNVSPFIIDSYWSGEDGFVIVSNNPPIISVCRYPEMRKVEQSPDLKRIAFRVLATRGRANNYWNLGNFLR